MKLLVASVMVLLTLLSSCTKNKSEFDALNISETYVDARILVSGTDIEFEGEYLARIGGRKAEIRVINSTNIEITIPEDARSGELRIVQGNRESSVGELIINRLYLLNNTKDEIWEYSIENGRAIKLIKDFGENRVKSFVFSEESNELIFSVLDVAQANVYYFHRINIYTGEESIIEYTRHENLTMDDQGKLFGISDGKIINQLSLIDGSIITELGSFESNIQELTFLKELDVFRAYFYETVDGIEYNYFEEFEISSSTVTKFDQEFFYAKVIEGPNSTLFAWIEYMGIVESTHDGSITDYLIQNEQYGSDFDYYEPDHLIVSVLRRMQNNGENPYQLAVKNLSTGTLNEYQISAMTEVLLARTSID